MLVMCPIWKGTSFKKERINYAIGPRGFSEYYDVAIVGLLKAEIEP